MVRLNLLILVSLVIVGFAVGWSAAG